MRKAQKEVKRSKKLDLKDRFEESSFPNIKNNDNNVGEKGTIVEMVFNTYTLGDFKEQKEKKEKEEDFFDQNFFFFFWRKREKEKRGGFTTKTQTSSPLKT